jgi:hypothetical protein
MTAHGSRGIVEWQPLWTTTPILWIMWLLPLMLVIACHWRIGISRPCMGVVVVLAAGGLWITRVSPLSAAADVVMAGPALARWAPILARDTDATRWGAVAVLTTFLAAFVLAVLPSTRCIAIQDSEDLPDATAVEILRTNRATGRLVTQFGWGQYAIWHLAPALKVSIDGRRETIYSERTIQRQVAVAKGSAEGLETLATTRPEYVWLSTGSATTTKAWLTGNGYRIDVDRQHSYIAVRQDLPVLQYSAVVESGCFPGP